MKVMLKADLHTHAGTHSKRKVLSYTPRDLISYASKRGYNVISITNHDILTYSKGLRDYAKKRGILLIPGVEKKIEGKEVIILNISRELMRKIKTFTDLEKYKNENLFVFAPHPFYPDPKALHSKLIENIRLFDGIEFSHFYLSWITFNTEAVKTARKYKLPLIGTSDCHLLEQLNYTYTLIDSEKSIDAVFGALRKRKARLVTRPLPFFKAIRFLFEIYVKY